jgi:hypothetical protein
MDDIDQKVGAMIGAAFAAVLIIVMLGSWKENQNALEITEFDVSDLYLEAGEPLPEIEFKDSILPDVLPPLYEAELPPLQGEV